MKTFSKIINAFLPAIFLIGLNIGTGSVTAMAKAGANYGMGLLWAIAFSCIVAYFAILYFGKYTSATGETVLHAFKKHIHPGVGIFFLVAIFIIAAGSIMGVMGIIADVLYVWSGNWIEGGVPAWIWAAGVSVFVYIMLWLGSTKGFEKALAILVSIMGIAFIINMVLMMPSGKEIAKGLIPSIPKTAATDSNAFLVTASMVGTTVSTMMLLVRSFLVKEEGWTMKDYNFQKKDTAVSVALMFVISASVMAAAAGTLHVRGLTLSKASEMIQLLEPIAGSAAVAIFVLGIAAAGISSQFPNILVFPWMISDYNGEKSNLKKPKMRLLLLGMVLLNLVVPVFGASPVFVMLASQAFIALILPASVIGIFYLTSKKKLMGEHANTIKDTIILSLMSVFALIMSGVSLYGFITNISNL